MCVFVCVCVCVCMCVYVCVYECSGGVQASGSCSICIKHSPLASHIFAVDSILGKVM